MRDTRMSSKYFEDYLGYQYTRIEKKKVKIDTNDGDKEKTQRVLLSLVGYEIDLLRAEFSIGAPAEILKGLLLDAASDISAYANPTKETLTVALSLSVMLDCPEAAEMITLAHSTCVKSDRVLTCLATFASTKEMVWKTSLSLEEEYSALEKGIDEESLAAYLSDWYTNHSDYAWYNAHLRDTETYCGYWSFEAAALAKIAGVRTEHLSENEYFPVL